LWLGPLRERGLATLSISDDALHYGDGRGQHAQRVQAAAEKLGLTAKVLCAERPTVNGGASGQPAAAGAVPAPQVAGGVMFRGRAAEKLAAGLPTRPWGELARCPHEDLANPRRVHLDCFGNVHLCQGLCLGNIWRTPLRALLAGYDPQAHPIVGPLLRGGPAELARHYGLPPAAGYVDECHLCYEARRRLVDRFPDLLAPRQVYGLK
jgi:hypothetical protein